MQIIPEKAQIVPLIFRGDGSGQKSPRRGIGLSSVMKSVEKYGGDADFRNEKGRFICRIILNLPRRSSAEELP